LAGSSNTLNVGFWSNQIPLRIKLRKDRKIKILLLLKLGIKVYQMITERYTHFNPLQKNYFTSNLSEGLKRMSDDYREIHTSLNLYRSTP
jgi:hypothetical protein